MSTESVQTYRQACAVQHGAHAIARARASTLGALRALLTHDSAHARKPAPTDRAPEATTQAHTVYSSSRQPPLESPACASGLAWPLAGRRGTPLQPHHTLAATQRPPKKMPTTFTSATPREQRSRFLRKVSRQVESFSPTISRTAGSASGSGR